MKNWFNSFILCTQPFLLPLIFDGSIVLCWLLFYLNNILLFLESPMVNCFFNIHSPFFLTNKPTFVGSSNVSSKKKQKTALLSFPYDKDNHVTRFWSVRCKQKLWGGASGKRFYKGANSARKTLLLFSPLVPSYLEHR